MKTEEQIQEERLYRLRKLHETVSAFVGSRGKPIRLNGEERAWDMHVWECNTSACALGSYALTPFGKQFFKISKQLDSGDPNPSGLPILHSGEAEDKAAAIHFHISIDEAKDIFIPDAYGAKDEDDPVPPSYVRDRISSIISAYKQGRGDEQQNGR